MTTSALARDAHPTRIGICADDFGLHESVNDAVLQLQQSRRLSAVSCLVDGPAWPDGARSLRDTHIDVGLHLNFTERLPGALFTLPLRSLVVRAYLRLLDYWEVRTSIEQQLCRFEEAMGRPPDFVDGHQHVHQLPIIRDALLSVLVGRYSSRPWLRSTTLGSHPVGRAHSRDRLKARTIALLGSESLKRTARRLDFPMNRALLGVYGFTPDAGAYEACLGQWFSAASDSDLLMCHPASAAVPSDPIAAARLREFEVLSGDVFEQHRREQRIAVVRLSDLFNDASPAQRPASGSPTFRAGVA